MDSDWVARILGHAELRGMGHGQRPEDANLGLGWLYYALARVERPAHAVCIGSWRGFVPIVLAQALRDNGEGGRVTFIDPSLADDFWIDPERTRAWFAGFGLDNVEHHRLTTQQYIETAEHRSSTPVSLLFVDGYHTAEQARFDHEAFSSRLTEDAVVLFHDSIRSKNSTIYGEDHPYVHTVHLYIDELQRRADLQVIDFALDSGVTIVRRRARAIEGDDRRGQAPGASRPSSNRDTK
ncbi:MAG: class I SAM-dependent methyltransferase [Gammaproteobacteria bacterium]|nr:class I SAM-dependent methyltransferase [Gammaproteobacteria bacterium]